ncbi:MAG: thermonuclease family protein [Elusimicrobia bacterium]|nr:thermonuclease family protein [Elusimicrobiota bacterium]
MIRRLALAVLLFTPAFAGAIDSPALRQLGSLAGGAGVDLPAASPAKDPPNIRWEDAAQYEGQVVTVEGVVVRPYANQNVCFLNFSEDFQNSLTLVIFASSFGQFPAGPQFYYQDKRVRATGKIQRSDRGQLQIILNDADQLRLLDPEAVPELDWQDVTAAHANQIITVTGEIVSVTQRAKAAFLNFHQNWTRYVGVAIFATAYPRFPHDLKAAYEGKAVKVTGRVKLYEGRPEIILFSSAQVQIVRRRQRVRLSKEKLVYDDGDTIRYAFGTDESPDGKPFEGGLRLLGFDTPETLHPEDGIFYDQPKGDDATALAKAAIGSGKKIEFVTNGERDKYGRMLGHLLIDGELLGALQLRAGLAYEMVGDYGDNGFPKEAAKLLEAWSKGPIASALEAGRRPPFVKPGDWRRLHQVPDLKMTREAWDAMSRKEKMEFLVKVKEIVRQRRRDRRNGDKPGE